MKITRRQLRQIIKEELDRLHEDEMSADEIRARAKEISDTVAHVTSELGIVQNWAFDKSMEHAIHKLRFSPVINAIMTGELKDLFIPLLNQMEVDRFRTKGWVGYLTDNILNLSIGTKMILKVTAIYNTLSDMSESGTLDAIWERSGGGAAGVREVVEEVEKRVSNTGDVTVRAGASLSELKR